MKFVKTWGGLGNQLFQYAFGLYLHEVTGQPVCYLDELGHPYADKGILNKVTNLPSAMVQLSYRKFYPFYFSGSYRIHRKLLQYFPQLSSEIIVEKLGEDFSESLLGFSLFDGYWQDLLFVEHVQMKLLSQIHLKKKNEQYSKVATLIQNSNLSISIHIRRGDYLKSDFHVVQDIGFIHQAIGMMNKYFTQPTYFVFSDDMEWAKKNLCRKGNFHFIENISDFDSTEYDFFLMQQCQHHIISNSTFSWWSAWLCTNPEKKVIAPSKWLVRKNHITKKMLPKEWILV